MFGLRRRFYLWYSVFAQRVTPLMVPEQWLGRYSTRSLLECLLSSPVRYGFLGAALGNHLALIESG